MTFISPAALFSAVGTSPKLDGAPFNICLLYSEKSTEEFAFLEVLRENPTWAAGAVGVPGVLGVLGLLGGTSRQTWKPYRLEWRKHAKL